MRYGQTKLQSAELLRLALARMAQHEAALNPLTFAVWYEHLAGINPGLSEALEHCLTTSQPLDDGAVQRLHRDHIAEIDEEAANRISADFGRVMQNLSETAASTGHSASAFGERLGTLHRSLAGDGAPVPTAMVDEAIDWTTRMQQAVESLQSQVATSQLEILRLRADLQRSREEALRCPLTGVLNRKGFDLELQTLLDEAGRSETSNCLVMIDIDHFKQVNDTHGHLVGDRVLEGLGQILQRHVSHPGAAVARYGGEEFALLLPRISVAQAVALAEAVRAGAKRMRIRHRNSGRTVVSVTVSVGVAHLRPGDDGTALVSRADEALYRSKQGGRDQVTMAPN